MRARFAQSSRQRHQPLPAGSESLVKSSGTTPGFIAANENHTVDVTFLGLFIGAKAHATFLPMGASLLTHRPHLRAEQLNRLPLPLSRAPPNNPQSPRDHSIEPNTAVLSRALISWPERHADSAKGAGDRSDGVPAGQPVHASPGALLGYSRHPASLSCNISFRNSVIVRSTGSNVTPVPYAPAWCREANRGNKVPS